MASWEMQVTVRALCQTNVRSASELATILDFASTLATLQVHSCFRG